MAYNVFRVRRTLSQSADVANRSAIHTANLENGSVFSLSGLSVTDKGCWTVAAPTANEEGLYVAAAPEVIFTSKEQGGSLDPRDYVNVAGKPFDAIKLYADDIVEMTGAGITGIAAATSTYLAAGTGFTFVASATAPTSGICLKKVLTTSLNIADGSIASTNVPNYIYRVVRN